MLRILSQAGHQAYALQTNTTAFLSNKAATLSRRVLLTLDKSLLEYAIVGVEGSSNNINRDW